MKKLSFYVTGNVQNVMFRQTFIRGAQKRKLKAGATNDANDRNRVHCSLAGDETAVDELINTLREGKPINSWNAYVEELHVLDCFIEISEHQVTTDNVNRFQWSPKVEFYL
ncbi:MAG: acylphosphatase [Burkholderiales bacterium]|nr:acylphosphatase [Burkholderiales bacterium]MDR4518382.1 acylphosphatase [Nitrosomonas sp.]